MSTDSDLLTVAVASSAAEMSRWAFRRWVRAREMSVDHDGRLLYPGLVQRAGRKWWVQRRALALALGRDEATLGRAGLISECLLRIDALEREVEKLQNTVADLVGRRLR